MADLKAMTAPDFLGERDPWDLFARWFAEAKASEPSDPNAIALATVDSLGLPNVRIVLNKASGPDEGFVFYTNYQSTKGEELLAQRRAALVFHWKSLGRQVRARGAVSLVSDREADAYFASRPRESQIGAWASAQSRPLENRAILEDEIASFSERFANADVPRPPHWSGFRLNPVYIEFWQERPYRLHDRLVFERSGVGWATSQLFP